MKYTAAQKEISVKKGLSLHYQKEKKRQALKAIFPIEVEIENGYYIIESKLNHE